MSLVVRVAAWVAVVAAGLCFNAHAETLQAPVQERIFNAVLPMSAADAANLADKLVASGIDQQHRADLIDYFRTKVFGDSIPMVLQAAGSPLCVAIALRYDVDQVMQFSPARNGEAEQAITHFLLVHEASHCRKILAQMRGEQSWPALNAQMTDADLWLEESLADLDARGAMGKLGRYGNNAIAAWERYRLFGFLKGNLDHWTTPLLPMFQKTSAKDQPPLDLTALEPGGDASYEAMNVAWRHLRSALFVGEDGSPAQAAAWTSAVQAFPVRLRPAIPSLVSLRALSKQLWPDAPDWRRKASHWR